MQPKTGIPRRLLFVVAIYTACWVGGPLKLSAPVSRETSQPVVVFAVIVLITLLALLRRPWLVTARANAVEFGRLGMMLLLGVALGIFRTHDPAR